VYYELKEFEQTQMDLEQAQERVRQQLAVMRSSSRYHM
jgi:hypothetical protein